VVIRVTALEHLVFGIFHAIAQSLRKDAKITAPSRNLCAFA
jgi:hypothetical protein